MMKKILALISLLSLLLIGADRIAGTVRLTIINKADMDIAVQLRSADHECANSKEIVRGDFYYLTVLEGTRGDPTIKSFDIKINDYAMQLYYLSTYDPVYGFKCATPPTNILKAGRDIRLTVLPCDFDLGPKQIGEPSMRKYLPSPATKKLAIAMMREYCLPKISKYWFSRLIY